MAKKNTSKIPQPRAWPILGHVHLLDLKQPTQSLVRIVQQFDEGIVRLNFGGQESIYVTSPAMVQELCDEKRFVKTIHHPLKELRPIGGDGLFTVEHNSPRWEKPHRVLMPVFGPSAMNGFIPAMLDIIEQMLLKWERHGDGLVVDIADNMTRLTLDTIALASFGYRFNSFYDKNMHPFVDAMSRALYEVGLRSQIPAFLKKLRVFRNRQFERDVRYLHDVARQLVRERKATGNHGHKDLLDAMLHTKDPVTGDRLDDALIGDEMVTFLIAGHETTSGLLSFAFHAMLKHPEVMQRAKKEVDEVLGGRTPRFEDVNHLVYMDQIFKETLRLWPTAPAFGVHSLEDHTVIGGRYEVSSHEHIMIFLPGLHCDKNVWKDPKVFNPDRMATEEFRKLPEGAWKPFGNGARACIGRWFAWQEATLTLAMALQRFEFAIANPDYQLRIKETLTWKPEGLMVRIRRRRDALKVIPEVVNTEKPSPNVSSETIPLVAGGVGLVVLYGSRSGSAETFARKIGSDAGAQGYAVEVGPLDDFVDKLPKDRLIIIVTASYDGRPPRNAKKFVEWLDTNPESVKGLKFAVFGCGNRDWAATYQAVPKSIDERMAALGAKRIMERGEADARGDFFHDFDAWYASLWARIGFLFGQEVAEPVKTSLLEVEFLTARQDTALKTLRLEQGRVVAARDLARAHSNEAPLRHVEFEIPEGMQYRVGDYLAVLETNPDADVTKVLRRFELEPQSPLVLRSMAKAYAHLPQNQPVTASSLVAQHLDLSQVASIEHIEQLAKVATAPSEKAALLGLIKNDSTYQSRVADTQLRLVDIVCQYSSCAIAFGDFLRMVGPLRPRCYSIASAPRPGTCVAAIIVNVAPPAVQSVDTRPYFRGLVAGDPVALRIELGEQGFRLPSEAERPLVLICSGVGIAPFRAFLDARARLAGEGAKVGETLLFYGCEHPDNIPAYSEELIAWAKLGILRFKTPFAANPHGPSALVQHELESSSAEILDLVAKDAAFYICGEGRTMVPQVKKALIEIVSKAGVLSAVDLAQWVAALDGHVRYVEDEGRPRGEKVRAVASIIRAA